MGVSEGLISELWTVCLSKVPQEEAFERRRRLCHIPQALALGPTRVCVALHACLCAASWWVDMGVWPVGADGRILH